ncbi:sigma-70 family RNA polymerase sigma factor [Neobacillus sp. NRS-1170]|uniref:sigma-70 family RNA polymerase sigma factor n=1 Tax=Neobacillus sp. NRS-1170 TaxID=3233898 RepID=UPI003D2D1D6F
MLKVDIADLPYNLDKEKQIDDLMNLYSQKVYLLAYSYVKDRGLAEDISQEVFIKCYKSLNQFRGESQISSWIYRITVNTAKDMLRSKGFNALSFRKPFLKILQRVRALRRRRSSRMSGKRFCKLSLVCPLNIAS